MIKKNEERAIIQAISSEAQNFIDKPQRVTLWIRDTLNNELWTYLPHASGSSSTTTGSNDRRVSFETSVDVIGWCCQTQSTVVIQNVKDSQFFDKDYEKVFEEIDPYAYKERTFVLAIPVRHPRMSSILGVLEICLTK